MAGRNGTPQSSEALNELCRAYWFPLYSFARRQGHTPPEAEDLTQGFFALLLEKNSVATADQEKGTFRTFLLTLFKRYQANQWNREHRQKRGGYQNLVSIDRVLAESRLDLEPVHGESPEALFERQWAQAVLARVIARLQQEYAESGRTTLFENLEPCLVRGDSPNPYSMLASRLKLTEAAVKMAVRRLRARYREILRDEIANTVNSPGEVEAELRHLLAAFAR